MKATLMSKTFAAVLALSLAWAMAAVADGTAPNQEETIPQQTLETYKGTIATLNEAENTITVDGFWTTKTFNTSEGCAVFLQDSPATPADLRPGQEVQIGYEKLDGVLIAKRINQQNTTYQGRITSLDREKGIIEVGDTWKSREFALPLPCPVVLRNNEIGALADLQTGQRVKVVFESPPDKLYQAVKIVQDYETFTGTIRAIDADTKTVKAKTLLNEKKFNLGRDCKVILADNTDGKLRDLQIGDRVQFSYEDADGVLVANLITRTAGEEESATVQASAPNKASP